MIGINNKAAYIKDTAETILENTEVLKSARLNKKQEKALQIIINLTGAIQEDAEVINNKLSKIVTKALIEQAEKNGFAVGEGEEAF